MSALHALTLLAHLSVAICGADRLSPNELAKAEQIAADVYRDVGVAIEWREACGSDALTVRVISSDAAETQVSKVALGYAEPGTTVATVLYDRMVKFSRWYSIKREVLLGYGIAHELGHLLLPPNSHSDSGVMRSSINLDLAATKHLRFTREQGQMIVDRLKASAVAVATH